MKIPDRDQLVDDYTAAVPHWAASGASERRSLKELRPEPEAHLVARVTADVFAGAGHRVT